MQNRYAEAARALRESRQTGSTICERQIDLGEGPSWKAPHTSRPVLVLDVTLNALWPELARDMRGLPVRSVFAFPLSVGLLDVGAMSLSTAEPRVLDEPEVEAASVWKMPSCGCAPTRGQAACV